LRTLVFIPTLNDTVALSALCTAVEALGPGFVPLVIDDGSRVAVAPAIDRTRTLFFRLPGNYGLGLCSHIAFDHGSAHGYDAIVRIDADGQHPVQAIPRLLAPLAEGRADLVVGRRSDGEGLPAAPVRRLVRGYYSLLSRLITRGAAPRDVNSGFFAIGVAAAARLNHHTLERYPEPELFVAACLEGLTVVEVAIEQSPRREGVSTLNLFQALRMLYRFNMFVLGALLRARRW